MRERRLTHTTVSAGQRALASASVENWLAPAGVVAAAGAGLATDGGVPVGAVAVGTVAGAGAGLAAAGATGAAGCTAALLLGWALNSILGGSERVLALQRC
jgi:hypothetical protein